MRPEATSGGAGEEGIQTSVHYPPIHTFTHYAALPQKRLPQTDAVARRILTLPLFGHMTEEQVDFVADRLVAAI